MEACGVGFKDSHSFLSMALKELPKSFELQELEKGHFPHFFNTPENQDYIGRWPDKKFYSPDTMKTDDRDKFLVWYDSQKDKASSLYFLTFLSIFSAGIQLQGRDGPLLRVRCGYPAQGLHEFPRPIHFSHSYRPPVQRNDHRFSLQLGECTH